MTSIWDARACYVKRKAPPGWHDLYRPHVCYEKPYVAQPSQHNYQFSTGLTPPNLASFPGGEAGGPLRYDNGNPKVIEYLSWDQAVQKYPHDISVQNAVKLGPSMFRCQYNGETFIIIPTNVQNFRQDPNLSIMLKSLLDTSKYEQMAAEGNVEMQQRLAVAQKQAQCFVYNTIHTDGTIIPLSIRATPECVQLAQTALEKCNQVAGDFVGNDRLATQGQSSGFPLWPGR